ncbi:MAG: hypothetical protein P9X24_03155 [Candidatus Hatepunaea meridiana]|nr:hypothetical protein [Candidatus Hatepunaea meridiana]
MVVLVEAVADQAADTTPVQEEPQQQSSEVVDASESEPAVKPPALPEQPSEDNEQDIVKMTVKQLQTLAKQRSIGIARTKDDFIRIIKLIFNS